MQENTVYSQIQIQVYTHARKLQYVKGQREIKAYPIAVGKPATPTPTGTFRIVNKIVNPGGILGTRWMGLDIPNGPYGIHGTFQPDSIGKAVSNGCIRMYNQDVEELFSQISVGTTVVISLSAPAPGLPGQKTEYITYTIRPGDTLWQIAGRFGIAVELLAAINNIDDPANLQIGQEIRIPQ